MQTLNNTDEEDRSLLMALEMYHLQTLRQMLVVILVVQLIIAGIGLTLVFQGKSLPLGSGKPSPTNSITGQGNDGFRFQPDEPHRIPQERQVALNTGKLV